MSVLAVIAALLLEQWRPLGDRTGILAGLARWANALERSFNAGESRHGAMAWLVGVVPAVLAAWLLHELFRSTGAVLGWIFDVAVLYLTLGFRQFSHSFTSIQTAVKTGDLEQAGAAINAWRAEGPAVHERETVIRLAIEEALLASHRHVFGVLLWYVLLPGPSGAVLYRLAAYLRRRWRGLGNFGEFAERAFYCLEWPAVRLSAAAFALVGDFEDAVYCWRTQARSWADANAGVLLAAGAGAMGVRLGTPIQGVDGLELRPELGVGENVDGAHLDSTVGLLWRALVAWVGVLLLLTAAHLLG